VLDKNMLTTLTKWVITVAMTGVIPITGIIYWGATSLRGKVCIALTGLFINVALAFWYSWLDYRPKNFTDWLRH
jgi:hypothetical protein